MNTNTYVFYLRDDHGGIERMNNVVTRPNGLMGVYSFEEILIDFPEAKVMWDCKSGPSVGVAPTAVEETSC